jgi:hypothetical protein
MKISINSTIDLDNIKVTNAIASVVNSAFETGLNPAWYEVESLNKDGFLDAAFEDMEPPSGKPQKTNWTLKVRLNYDGYKSKWKYITPDSCVNSWLKMKDDPKLKFLNTKADAYLRYLAALSQGKEEVADKILFDEYEPDGVHDDALAQYAVADDVVFG